MKKLHWYDIRETQKIKIIKQDMNMVNKYLDQRVELEYDPDTLRVYNEGGEYIADILSIEED